MDINPGAIVSPKAGLGARVTVGPFTVIHDNVAIGDDSVIDGHCVLGYPSADGADDPLEIGAGAKIRSHSVFYSGSRFGAGLRTGHRVTVREGIVAGRDLQIGTLSDLQGHARIGDHVRTHSNVHIGQKTEIGDCVWVFPYVVFTNDPHPPSDGFLSGAVIEDYAVIATMSCIMPGVRVGTRSLVGAHSLVTRDVEEDTVVVGVPAKVICKTTDVKLRDGSGRSAYPWMRHFHRGYPASLVEAWRREYGELPRRTP